MDRGAWQATVYSIAERRTQVKQLSMHTQAFSTLNKQNPSLIPFPL